METNVGLNAVLVIGIYFIVAASLSEGSSVSTYQRFRRANQCTVLTHTVSCFDARRRLVCPWSCPSPHNHAPAAVQTTPAPTTVRTTTTTTTTTTSTTTTPAPSTTPFICQDHYPNNCLLMASACPNDPLVRQLCPVTCSACGPSTSVSTSPSPPTTVATTTTVATSAAAVTKTSNTGSPPSCYQCGHGPHPCTRGDLLHGQPTPCPPGTDFCQTAVNQRGGHRTIYKKCVNKATCAKDWTQVTSHNNACVKFDPKNLLVTINCKYCCVGDACNSGVKPTVADLYNPQKNP